MQIAAKAKVVVVALDVVGQGDQVCVCEKSPKLSPNPFYVKINT
jgi:hypothetical protein